MPGLTKLPEEKRRQAHTGFTLELIAFHRYSVPAPQMAGRLEDFANAITEEFALLSGSTMDSKKRSDKTIDMQFSQFDPNTRRIAEQLAAEALVSVPVLSDELQQYVENLDAHPLNAELYDNDVGKRIATLCWKLLDALPARPDERQHRLTQLAINYFVLAEDAQDDNHSLAGFEDDLQVVTAVIHELGLEHLLDE